MRLRHKIVVVAGARPNFVKINLLVKHLKKIRRFTTMLVHTGQHHDFTMSEIFFRDLSIPRPDYYLNAGGGSHATQTARIMVTFEKVILKERPDWVFIVGDVNSTLACALVGAKLGIKVAHVEAGLRSFDRSMPEEINRILTDAISDLLFVSEPQGVINLKGEGISEDKIYFVGNTMIDTLLANQRKIDRSNILARLNLAAGTYGVTTLHRPSNVDSREALQEVHEILQWICERIRIVYPVHPRSLRMIRRFGLLREFKAIRNLMLIEPLGYIDFMKLTKSSAFVLTDSGGIQEETTMLGIPCLTMRENTERPVTITEGTDVLVGRQRNKIEEEILKICRKRLRRGRIPDLWDGKACERIVGIMKDVCFGGRH